jgi:uncharacterized protein YidB (DUF937 family)
MSMDVFGQLLKGLAGGGAGGPDGAADAPDSGVSSVMRGVFDMLGDQGSGPTVGNTGGGLQDLIRGFQNRGMGDVVSSWIGTGDNMPITPDQVQQGLGRDRAQQMAQRSGMSLEALLPMLATALPMVIDMLTPKGQVPDGSSLQQSLQSLRGRLG